LSSLRYPAAITQSNRWRSINGVDPFWLQEAGSWSSLAMPRHYGQSLDHYVEAAKIANEGMGD
jgi:hypothetical protein